MKGRRPFTARPRRALIKGLSRAHRAVYRASSGRIFGSLAGMPVLLLTTTGRRSGKRSTTPLTFLRDRADLVLIASNGGADRPPGWWLNLQRNPRAAVERKGEPDAHSENSVRGGARTALARDHSDVFGLRQIPAEDQTADTRGAPHGRLSNGPNSSAHMPGALRCNLLTDSLCDLPAAPKQSSRRALSVRHPGGGSVPPSGQCATTRDLS